MKTGVCSYCQTEVTLDPRGLIAEHYLCNSPFRSDCGGEGTIPEIIVEENEK